MSEVVHTVKKEIDYFVLNNGEIYDMVENNESGHNENVAVILPKVIFQMAIPYYMVF